MKKKRKKKKAVDDMNVKPEKTWQIVKNADGSYQWFKTVRGK